MLEGKNSIYIGWLLFSLDCFWTGCGGQLTLLNFCLCGSVFLTVTWELKMASHCLSKKVNERNLKNYQEGKDYLLGTPQSFILAGPTSTVWASPPMPSCLGWAVTSRGSTSWALPWRCLNLRYLWFFEAPSPGFLFMSLCLEGEMPRRFRAVGGSRRALYGSAIFHCGGTECG